MVISVLFIGDMKLSLAAKYRFFWGGQFHGGGSVNKNVKHSESKVVEGEYNKNEILSWVGNRITRQSESKKKKEKKRKEKESNER